MPTRPHDEIMRKYLADPAEAEAYLNLCLEDGNPWLIADAFRLVESIHGKKLRFQVHARERRRPRRVADRVRPTVAPKRTRVEV